MDRSDQLKRFYRNELSDSEREDLLAWMKSREAEDMLSEQIDTLWHSAEADDREALWDADKLFEKIETSRQDVSQAHMTVYDKPHNRPKGLKFFWYGLVAAVALLVAVTLVITRGSVRPSPARGASLIVKENPAGRKSLINLPDGTVVHLNADSRLVYSSSFDSTREVALTGEAFFDVVNDPARPFKVISGRLSTTALGTSFNVQAFENSVEIQVTLVSGEALVKDVPTNQSLVLSPNEQACLAIAKEELKKKKLDKLVSVGWKDGVLWFDQTPFSKVILQLERWYGVDIQLRGKHGDPKCSGSFKDEYLANVLNVLSHNLGFTYTIEQKQVTINFNAKR